MARVKTDVQAEVAKMIDHVPDDTLNTCGLCNRTLFDKLMEIQVKTGAPQMTVCSVFANRYNLTKRVEDHVSAKAFKDRLQYIHKINARELSAQSAQINNDSSSDSDTSADTTGDQVDLSAESGQIKDGEQDSSHDSALRGSQYPSPVAEAYKGGHPAQIKVAEHEHVITLLQRTPEISLMDSHKLLASLAYRYSNNQRGGAKGLHRLFMLALDVVDMHYAEKIRQDSIADTSRTSTISVLPLDTKETEPQ